MEPRQKWISWILAAGIIILTVTGLGIYTFSGNASENHSSVVNPQEEIMRGLFAQSGSLTLEPVENADGPLYRAVSEGRTAGFAAQRTVQGYAGPVEVITAVRADGTIEGVHVGGEEFRETEGLGAKAREAAFTDQFRSSKLPVMLERDIDAIAGATVTSQAVVDAVNQALPLLQSQPEYSGAPVSQADSSMTANASVIGYGGPVLVRLTLDEQGRIAAVDIGGARFAETEGVGSRIREDSFTRPLIGLVPPIELNREIDAVSGATISSQAAVDAINEAAAFLTDQNTSEGTK